MMIEVGIDNKLWWSKQDQILRYVEQLLEKREEDLSNEKPSSKKSLKVPYTFDEPILLTIITVDKEKMKVRFGMFLCTRKKAHTDYRIALLWRMEATSFNDASTQFGKVLYAAKMCAYLRQHKVATDLYEYLGPNCCRFGRFVSILNCAIFQFHF